MASSGVVPGGGAGGGVTSFNGRGGVVALSKADVTGTGLAAGDVGASAPGHAHGEGDVTNLVADLGGKAPSVHTHAEADVTNLAADLAGKAAAAHGHAEADTANLVADLAGKSAVGHGHAEADTANLVADLAVKLTAANIATAAVATAETTTATTFVDLATVGPAVTVTIGASGRALVILGGQQSNNTIACYAICGVALSGANTVAANAAAVADAVWQVQSAAAGNELAGSRATVLTGLAAGATTFTMKYREAGASGTASFTSRRLIVVPL